MQPVAPVKTENVQPEHGLIGLASHSGVHKCDVNLHFKSNSSVSLELKENTFRLKLA